MDQETGIKETGSGDGIKKLRWVCISMDLGSWDLHDGDWVVVLLG